MVEEKTVPFAKWSRILGQWGVEEGAAAKRRASERVRARESESESESEKERERARARMGKGSVCCRVQRPRREERDR